MQQMGPARGRRAGFLAALVALSVVGIAHVSAGGCLRIVPS